LPNRDSVDVTNTEQIEAAVNKAAEGELDFPSHRSSPADDSRLSNFGGDMAGARETEFTSRSANALRCRVEELGRWVRAASR
jgi:hypothetical protein